jgi:hypothetical protein
MIAPLRIRDLIAMLVWLWRNPFTPTQETTQWPDTPHLKQRSAAHSQRE